MMPQEISVTREQWEINTVYTASTLQCSAVQFSTYFVRDGSSFEVFADGGGGGGVGGRLSARGHNG